MRTPRLRRASLIAAGVIVLTATACVSTGANTTMRTPNVPVPTTIETATGVSTVDIRNSTASVGSDISAPLEKAWIALPKVYDAIGLTQGGSTDPEGHTYGVLDKRIARIAGKRMGQYLDCGDSIEGPRADIYEVRISVFTALWKKDGGTRVETLVQARAKPRGVSGNSVSCRSRGTLEPLITERLVAGVAS